MSSVSGDTQSIVKRVREKNNKKNKPPRPSGSLRIVAYGFSSLFRCHCHLISSVRRSFVEFSGGRDVWRRSDQYPGDRGVVEKKHFGVHRTTGDVSARSQDGRRLQPADDLLRKSGGYMATG